MLAYKVEEKRVSVIPTSRIQKLNSFFFKKKKLKIKKRLASLVEEALDKVFCTIIVKVKCDLSVRFPQGRSLVMQGPNARPAVLLVNTDILRSTFRAVQKMLIWDMLYEFSSLFLFFSFCVLLRDTASYFLLLLFLYTKNYIYIQNDLQFSFIIIH